MVCEPKDFRIRGSVNFKLFFVKFMPRLRIFAMIGKS